MGRVMSESEITMAVIGATTPYVYRFVHAYIPVLTNIRHGTNLWLILTDKKMETILFSNLMKTMILIKLMETILWKIIWKRGALLDL